MGLSPAHGPNLRLPPKNPFQSMRSKPTPEPVHGTCSKSRQERICHTSNSRKRVCQKKRLDKPSRNMLQKL